MTTRVLAAAPRRGTGFTPRFTIDDSPEARRRTSLAVTRAKAGDPEAIRYLYARYSNNVFGCVRQLLHDDHDAEDITQLVFAKLMVSLPKYDERGAPFFAWLLRVARNAAIDHMRANRLVPSEDPLAGASAGPVDVETTYALRDALRTLSSAEREVVVLRHIAGLTPREVARRIGRTESAVHTLHSRGRQALRRELTERQLAPSTRPQRRAA
jgi:RNA polymerase sigma-70 factor (ECF subfamily)